LVSSSVIAAIIGTVGTVSVAILGWIIRAYRSKIQSILDRQEELDEDIQRLESQNDELRQFLFGTKLNGNLGFAETVEGDIESNRRQIESSWGEENQKIKSVNQEIESIKDAQEYLASEHDVCTIKEVKKIRRNS
jgi:prefoldin subunit 5